jgi:hypothetical protein
MRTKKMGKATLYQRLRTKGFPWVVCPVAKNGSPKPSPDAFQFASATLDGDRPLEPFATLDEAVANLKSRNVQFCAAHNGVATPQATANESEPRITIESAVVTYFANLVAQGKDPKTIRTYRVAVDGLVATCSKKYVDETGKQDRSTTWHGYGNSHCPNGSTRVPNGFTITNSRTP